MIKENTKWTKIKYSFIRRIASIYKIKDQLVGYGELKTISIKSHNESLKLPDGRVISYVDKVDLLINGKPTDSIKIPLAYHKKTLLTNDPKSGEVAYIAIDKNSPGYDNSIESGSVIVLESIDE